MAAPPLQRVRRGAARLLPAARGRARLGARRRLPRDFAHAARRGRVHPAGALAHCPLQLMPRRSLPKKKCPWSARPALSWSHHALVRSQLDDARPEERTPSRTRVRSAVKAALTERCSSVFVPQAAGTRLSLAYRARLTCVRRWSWRRSARTAGRARRRSCGWARPCTSLL